MYKFKGDQIHFIQGAPARDLSDDEFNALPVDVQKACTLSGIYVKTGEVKNPAPAKNLKQE